MAIKVILDTDIGTDIDDAYALAFCLRQPEFDLQAVTTVTGHPVERAKLVRHLLAIGGRPDLPVAAGWSLPLAPLSPGGRKAYLERKPNHTGVASRVPEFFRPGTAVPLILETVNRHPGEVALVAIGPLTNIAAAITADPDLPQKVKCVAMMGGDLNRNWQEYNVRMDPEAADIVFASGAPMFLATWEVSRQLVLLPEHLERVKAAGDPLCATLIKCTDLWWPHRRNKPGPVLYDVSPFLWLLDRAWFETLRTAMRVETANPALRGMTFKDAAGESPLEVTTQFKDADRARELLLERLARS